MSMMRESRQIHFPYCLQRQSNGRYVLLNRNYKPLGFVACGYIKYEDFPVSIRLRLTKKIAVKLSIDEDEDLNTIYLYNDGTIPTSNAGNMRAYLDRLAILMKVQIEHEEGSEND